MSLSSDHLDAFWITAQCGSFTHAAQRLHISQSALSQRIAKLEADIETAVFIREKAGIRLTPTGEELLRYCQARHMLEQEALERIKGQGKSYTGIIRIGGFSSVMRSVILPALTPLLRDNQQLRLIFVAREMDELPRMLRLGEIDYMIHYDEYIHSDIETLTLGIEKNVLVQSKTYQGGEIYLDHDENDKTTARYLKMTRSSRRIKRRYLDDVYGLIDGVRAGIGKAVLPYHLIKDDKTIEIIDRKAILDFPVILHHFSQPYYTELHFQVVKLLKAECARKLNLKLR